MNEIILTGFLIGLTSNFHCVGMCGPIALAIPVNRQNNLTIFKDAFLYNFGRIITYSLLGAIAGMIGLTIQTFNILQWLSIISGIIVILYAWKKYFLKFLPKLQLNGFFSTNKIGSWMRKSLNSSSPFRLLFFGIINGLLPCGMVYLALANAILSGNLLNGALAMFSFGVGTLPVMVGIIIASNKISPKVREKMNRMIPYMLTIVGLLIILRGLNLGIPYISPKVSFDKTAHQTKEDKPKNEVTMDCCHKPE